MRLGSLKSSSAFFGKENLLPLPGLESRFPCFLPRRLVTIVTDVVVVLPIHSADALNQ